MGIFLTRLGKIRVVSLGPPCNIDALFTCWCKTCEARTYELGHRKIAQANEETWIVETRGPHAHPTTNVICDGLEVAPRPCAAQIVGTVSFDSASLYDNIGAGAEHCRYSFFSFVCFLLRLRSVFVSVFLWLKMVRGLLCLRSVFVSVVEYESV